MQYMLLIIRDDAVMTQAAPEQRSQMMGAFMAYTQAMREAGVLVAGDALQPSSTATTVRVRDGQTQVLDGPYAEAKEQLGGYYLIEAPDLDSALSWAARCPGAAFGAIEVRPVMVLQPA
ncbi:MAG: PhnB protein [Caulobacteraceae bacterium]|nr:PhnB protein [Caulobacteraceae bacterium]